MEMETKVSRSKKFYYGKRKHFKNKKWELSNIYEIKIRGRRTIFLGEGEKSMKINSFFSTTCSMSAWSAFLFFPLSQPMGLALEFNGQTSALAIGSEAEWEAKQVEEEAEGYDERLVAATVPFVTVAQFPF